MPDAPRTWQLVEEVKTVLAGIRQADGYHTDAGQDVTLEPAQVPDDGASVLAVVMDAALRPVNEAMVRIGRTITVLILAKVSTAPDASDAQLKLHQVIDDVDRAMSAEHAYPKQVQKPQFLSVNAIPPAEGVSWVGAEIRYTANVIPGTR